jgi:hypothetical protein
MADLYKGGTRLQHVLDSAVHMGTIGVVQDRWHPCEHAMILRLDGYKAQWIAR